MAGAPTASAPSIGTRVFRVVLALGIAASVLLPRAEALDPSRSINQYNLRTWRRSNQIPSDSINAIVQSGDGHLLLGTPLGLVDFDGVEFRALGLPGQVDTNSHAVRCLSPRDAGGFWVGLERGDYGWFADGRYVPFEDGRIGGDSPTTRRIWELPDHGLLIGTYGTLGHRAPGGVETVLRRSFDVMGVHEDSAGRVWLGTVGCGLWYWKDGQMHEVAGPAAELWRNRTILAVAVDQSGVVWIAMDDGVHALNADFSVRTATGIECRPQALLLDRHGVLWIGDSGQGLLRYKDGVLSRLDEKDGLAGDRVQALFESADGSLWVGTGHGLTQLSDVKFPIVSSQEGLAGRSCMAVMADPTGGIWAGTDNGLTRLRDGHNTNYGVGAADGFSSEWIREILVARNGDLYLLGGKDDLMRFRGSRVDRVWHPGPNAQSIAEDGQGVLLSVLGKVVRLREGGLAPLRLADGTEPDFCWISKLLVDRNGALWVAANPGLFRISDGRLNDALLGRPEAKLFFYDLCEDPDGGVWGLTNAGLVRVKDGKVATVDHRHGLASDICYSLVPDKRGDFWIDSPEGILRVSRREMAAAADGTLARIDCAVFNGSHVAKELEKFNGEYSGCLSRDGHVWFAGAQGVIEIDPECLRVNSVAPLTTIQRVLVDGRALPADVAHSLSPGVRNLEFTYGATDYQAPERIRYRYRLHGYQEDWVDAQARRSAFFTNLEPGAYRFEVQACNADGVWDEKGATFGFSLLPHLYERWWFRAGGVATLLGLVGFISSVRERRRRREIEVIENREKLQAQMIESSPVPMAMFDREHRVLYVNATFTRVLGYTAAEIPTLEAWWKLAAPDPASLEEWVQGWNRRVADAALSHQAIAPVETTVLHKDRTLRHIVATTSAVGERTLLICADLTERKQAEDERRSYEEQRRQGQKMEAVGRLSGGIAHDFNNLLTVILGNIMLLETEPLAPDVSESVGEIKGAASRAANLTKQLLAFSRKQPINPVVVDVNGVVREMAGMLRSLAGELVVIELALASKAVPARVDATMLEQVVLNLVLNARDAMPQGGKLVISTSLVQVSDRGSVGSFGARSGEFVLLAVSDTGSGIDPEILPRIFEPFFTTKAVGKGTGLGLATVYGIVDQHRGWVDARSEVGRGSTFQVYLPAELETALPVVAAGGGEPRPIVSAGHVVLLVEDNDGVRTMARRALVANGYEVIEAASGPAALLVWAAHCNRIEVLFTDVVMPDGMTGIELAQRLLAEKPTLKVLYASGYSADVVGGDFSGREGVDFLGKPYKLDDLLRLVAKVVDRVSD